MLMDLPKNQDLSLKINPRAELDEIIINLNWKSIPIKRAIFSKLFNKNSIDLDLGCLYELKNGEKGTVQALGNTYGSLSSCPYIVLDGDDRTGFSPFGESIRINGSQIGHIKRILIYVFIYKGMSNWKQAEINVTIKHSGIEDIIMKLDHCDSKKRLCGIVLFENINDITFSVEKINRFYSGHKALDKDFHWGLNWIVGEK